MHFGAPFDPLVVPEVVIGLMLEATKILCKEGDGDNSKNFSKGGRGGPMITSGLGLSWVMVLLGPWSLVLGKGQGRVCP